MEYSVHSAFLDGAKYLNIFKAFCRRICYYKDQETYNFASNHQLIDYLCKQRQLIVTIK